MVIRYVNKATLFKIHFLCRNTCDMIRGNEPDVGNIVFELQAKTGDKFLFYIDFELQRIVHISVNRCQIDMGFRSNCSISRAHSQIPVYSLTGQAMGGKSWNKVYSMHRYPFMNNNGC